VEAISTKATTESIIIKFLEENILSRFGCPRKIITDNSQVSNLPSYYSFIKGIT
jgi:hypothetical protein